MNFTVGKDNYTDILLREKEKNGIVYHSDNLMMLKMMKILLVNQKHFSVNQMKNHFETIDFILRMESQKVSLKKYY